ncbi:ABC transporter permease subunit [Streptomyces endophyticus]|uniref:ATP-binding cassette domain-containing protein n=1 Tax=Streptomyces endophyticus TaxID=714166 RepID=A0ABU6FGW4_9ACTN|nr:ATP-binding cassette domain-containing protein [Streptomyces endophyticus]MEB8343282.1 ATP-binding cassette domain-containing protein [Streptomyces endophyticus]
MSSLTYDLTLAGLSVGAAAALTGIGLIVTYRATGVLNFAHGAIAMLCAYLLRQLVVGWEVPLWAAAALVLLVVAPGFGLALERWVFRPLALSGGDQARTLVASIGVFVLLVGAAALLWGTGAQEDAPRLIPGEPWGQLAVACAIGGAVWAVTRRTRFGGELRAVVDNRPLAVLGGIDADRVAAAGWAFGTFTAGLTGVLLAPYVRLDPYGLPLLVMEVVAVAVAAGMRRLGVAVAAALAIGVAQSQLTRLHPRGWAEPLVQAVGANLFVVALLVAALALPGVDGKGALPTAVTRRTRAAPRGAWLVAGVLFLLPLGFAGSDLRTSIQVPALALILLSLVVVTGRAGQLALGQGAFAGLGALFATLLSTGRFPGFPQLPGLLAILASVVMVAPLGLLTAAPAIRRHGLALALATFAVGVGVSRFVFAQPYAASGLTPPRPAGFGDDRVFYVLELALLGGALVVVAGLRRGRVGRALAAVRDHEAGASAAGVGVPGLKVAVFVVGAGLAALGGGLLTFGLHSFDPSAYDPVRGLLWFAAVVVLGADNPLGALLGAGLLVGLDAGARGGVAALTIGVLAVLVGRGLDTRNRHRSRLTERAAAIPLQPPAHQAPAALDRRAIQAPPAHAQRAIQAPPAHAQRAIQAPAAIEQRGPGQSPVAHTRSTATRRRPTTPPTLSATHLTVTYGPHTVLQDTTIRLPSGSVTAVVGPNGAGKTTLFHCLAGTVRPDTGHIFLGPRDVTRLPAHARTRLGIARTFQQLVVFPSLTVAENIRIGAEQGRVRDPGATERMTRLFGLRGEQETDGLPTGTLRRVELGRALAGDPHVLLLDEPTAGLDPTEVAALARLLRALAADGVAVLVVEHDLDLVAELADTVHVMAAGRIVSSGSPDSVLDRTPEPS